jgi:hypothetical protein
VNFYPSTEVKWRTEATGASLTASSRGHLNATVATVAAPGVPAGAISAVIHWGDGTTSRAAVAGRGPAEIRINGLYTVHGQHTYAHPGTHHGTVTIRAPHQPPITVPFTVVTP